MVSNNFSPYRHGEWDMPKLKETRSDHAQDTTNVKRNNFYVEKANAVSEQNVSKNAENERKVGKLSVEVANADVVQNNILNTEIKSRIE